MWPANGMQASKKEPYVTKKAGCLSVMAASRLFPELFLKSLAKLSWGLNASNTSSFRQTLLIEKSGCAGARRAGSSPLSFSQGSGKPHAASRAEASKPCLTL